MGQWYPGEGTSAPGCGDDPCSLADYLWVSDQCAAWLECAGQPAVTVSNVLGQGTSSINAVDLPKVIERGLEEAGKAVLGRIIRENPIIGQILDAAQKKAKGKKA